MHPCCSMDFCKQPNERCTACNSSAGCLFISIPKEDHSSFTDSHLPGFQRGSASFALDLQLNSQRTPLLVPCTALLLDSWLLLLTLINLLLGLLNPPACTADCVLQLWVALASLLLTDSAVCPFSLTAPQLCLVSGQLPEIYFLLSPPSGWAPELFPLVMVLCIHPLFHVSQGRPVFSVSTVWFFFSKSILLSFAVYWHSWLHFLMPVPFLLALNLSLLMNLV